jgi:N-acetyl-gamma-glutamyl-phosphate reductase
MSMNRVVVIGASGYTGIEAVSLLSRHPGVDLVGVFGSPGRVEAPVSFGEVAPALRGVVDLELTAFDLAALEGVDAAILATPHEASAEIAPELVERGVKVVDLSGAFRLDAEMYPLHYGFEHPCPELLAEAAYGLPEIGRVGLAEAPVIGVAGCYPTSVIIPLKTMVDGGALKPSARVIVDSVSGVSGAGRKANLTTSFCEVSLSPYNVLAHRHAPEMAKHAGTPVLFTPQVAPFDRGIVSTIHVELADGWDEASLRDLMQSTLGGEPFVRLLGAGTWPSVGAVRLTNFIDIGLTVRDGHAVVIAAIDNLVKGAAGQGVQCLNIALGIDETAGLVGREAVWA